MYHYVIQKNFNFLIEKEFEGALKLVGALEWDVFIKRVEHLDIPMNKKQADYTDIKIDRLLDTNEKYVHVYFDNLSCHQIWYI